jgi:hypothetical protein
MIYRDALIAFGVKHQKLMMIEEMSELTKALLKSIREDKEVTSNMIEEIADVEITLSQMKEIINMAGYGPNLAEIKQMKITRLEKRVTLKTEKTKKHILK